MKTVLLILCLAAASISAAEGLYSEAVSFLIRLSSQGHTGSGIMALELSLLMPCTMSVYPPSHSAGGFYIGMGGNNTLNLGLRLEGEGWFMEDSMPDDLPVLRLDSTEVAEGNRLIICATDMIRGCRTDSAMVIWAFLPVDRNGL